MESERNITLVEGGYQENLVFKSFVPPSVYCLDLSSVGISKSLPSPLKPPSKPKFVSFTGSILGLLRGNIPECNVEVEIATQSYLDNLLPHTLLDGDRQDVINVTTRTVGLPKCHNYFQALRQVVVGYHDYNNGSDETCSVLLTEENWMTSFQ